MENGMIRDMELTEFRQIYRNIERDFARGEYPPYDVLLRQLSDGQLKGYVYIRGDRRAAYAICAENTGNSYVLLSLLAVESGLRGHGVGSSFVGALKQMYTRKNGVIVEVEKTEDAKNDHERAVRERRVGFYQRCGFCRLPGLDYSIWGVPMDLMALPILAEADSIERDIGPIMYDIYLALMGERYMHKMKLCKTEG